MKNIPNALHLSANNAYSKTSLAPITSDINASYESFNNVLSNIKAANIGDNLTITPPASSNSNLMKFASEALNKARDKLRYGEEVTSKALVKQASLTEMVTALTEAQITLQSVVNVRDKVIAAYQDIIKMQM